MITCLEFCKLGGEFIKLMQLIVLHELNTVFCNQDVNQERTSNPYCSGSLPSSPEDTSFGVNTWKPVSRQEMSFLLLCLWINLHIYVFPCHQNYYCLAFSCCFLLPRPLVMFRLPSAGSDTVTFLKQD